MLPLSEFGLLPISISFFAKLPMKGSNEAVENMYTKASGKYVKIMKKHLLKLKSRVNIS